MAALRETNFAPFSGQTEKAYRGKVRDTYSIRRGGHNLLAVVATDRISAFDHVLPNPIADKGQVLNEMSAHLLSKTGKVVPNWLIDVPDPNVSIGHQATPFKLEMIMRGFLLGSSWKAYSREEMRHLGGTTLPNGMEEFDPFRTPILTPTTKAETGHDENITYGEIIESGLATKQEFDEMEGMAKLLFLEGQLDARSRGLTLADTKYEFGKLPDGKIVVIDEVHTPDSSRYFPTAQFMAYQRTGENRPEQLSKEFVREWLVTQGFDGSEGQTPPEMPADFQREVSQRYADLYTRMTGTSFESANDGLSSVEIQERIRQSIIDSLKGLDL